MSALTEGEVNMPLPNVTRIEVIDSTGRAFTRYYDIAGCSVTTQDGTRTLKVFANVPQGDNSPAPMPHTA
jgi:hypothetical protein